MTTDINADRLASFRKGSFRDIVAREASKPLPSGCSANGDGLNVPLDRTGETQLETPYITNIEVFTIKPPARLFECKTIIPVSTFKSREARFIAILNSGKEASVGFVQSLKDFLKNLRAYLSVFWKGTFQFGKLINLAVAGNGAFVLSVNGNALLKGSVIEVSAKVKPAVGSLEGLKIRTEAILKGLLHLPCTLSRIACFEKGDKPYRALPSVFPL